MQDPTASNFYAGGRLVYDSSATHDITGVNYFDLAGPTSHSATYALDAAEACTPEGSFKTVSVTALNPAPFDTSGTIWFGNNLFTYISSGGNPVMMVGAAAQAFNAATFTNLAKHVFSGIYTSFDWPGIQTRHKVFLFPDSAGTTFTIRESTSDTDPTLYNNLGTLACTSLNTPSGRFCSGTLDLDAVGGTGNAVCTVSTLGQPTLICAAQRPDYTTVPVSILASVPTQTVLSVTVSPTVAQVATAGASTTITATLTNLSGRAITSLANPGAGLDLVAPFSNVGAYAGTGGTCSTTLNGYSSCIVNITYNPSALGTHLQTFRVAYNNGAGVVNATANLIGTAGLSSIDIDQKQTNYGTNSAQPFSVTATYTDGSTQDVSSAVSWSSSASSRATFDSNGIAHFFALGNTNLGATLGSSSDSFTASVVNRSDYFNVLGQTNLTSVATANRGLNGPFGLTVSGTKMIVADGNNNRVLIWNTLPTADGTLANFVLGQPNFTSVLFNNTVLNADTMGFPTGVCTNGTRLAVADSGNNRVLLWDSFPTANSQPADLVLGQAGMGARATALTSQGLGLPRSCAITGTKLIVSDSRYNRVLIWNSWPTVNRQAADLVLGQSDFTSEASGSGSSQMATPQGVYSDGTRLGVADFSNNRVLIWSSFPTANGQAASLVLGQSAFGTGLCNRSAVLGAAPADNTLCAPRGLYFTASRLHVADYNNGRTLLWNSFPTTNGQPASVVVGQPAFTTANSTDGAADQWLPAGVADNGTKLLIADTGNSRVLIYNTIPTANGASANNVTGQTSFSSQPNAAGFATLSGSNFSTPSSLAFDGAALLVADSFNNRVLIWSTIPTTDNRVANVVLGQANLTTNSSGNGASQLNAASGVTSNRVKVAVADSSNHRLLIWNTFPTASGQAANVVLGQADMTSVTANRGGSVSSLTVYGPRAVSTDGKRLAVADYLNNRVLVWNSWPTANGTAADLVLGQPSMTTNSPGLSDAVIDGPLSVLAMPNRLYVGDANNSRVLVWSPFPTASGQPATFVLGQADFTTNDTTTTTAASVQSPRGIASDGRRLFISDGANNRIAVWNTLPTITNQPGDDTIGQPSVSNGSSNWGEGSPLVPTGSYSSTPIGVASDGQTVFYVDSRNQRIAKAEPRATYYSSLAISDGPTYAYGAQTANNAYTKTFTVSNSGGAIALNLGIGSPALGAPFYYQGGTYPGVGGTCGTSLAGGASCTLVVDFVPVSPGVYSGTIALQYTRGDGGAYQTASVDVSGSVLVSNLTISNGPTYNFGTVTGATTKAFTITNPGGARATNIWSGTPALAAPYSFLGGQFPGTGGTCTTKLDGGDTCTIVTEFNPTSTGTFNDTVRLSYIDANSVSRTLTVGVTGTK